MLGAILSLALTVSSFASSITLNQPTPHFGDAVTFSVVYPQDAAKQARQPQYPDNPTTQIDCYQAGVRVFTANQKQDPKAKTKVTGGWAGSTYPVQLGPVESNGLSWTSGGASCGAILYSFTNAGATIWASTQFEVLP